MLSRSSHSDATENRASDASARPAGASGKADFASFRIIADRNIFDPNRPGGTRRVESTPRQKTPDSFTLVGIISYEKGTFAFFDGTSSDYKKALKCADTIAGYKVASIAADTVKLAAGTNQVELRVGMQMRREEDGQWQPGSRPETYAASSNSSAAAHSDPASTTEENEVLKRLRLKKEQE